MLLWGHAPNAAKQVEIGDLNIEIYVKNAIKTGEKNIPKGLQILLTPTTC